MAAKKRIKTSRKGRSGQTRYSQTEKAEILSFADDYDSEYGRGGIRAAAEKFGTTQQSIGTWRREQAARTIQARASGGVGGTLGEQLQEIIARLTRVEEFLGL